MTGATEYPERIEALVIVMALELPDDDPADLERYQVAGRPITASELDLLERMAPEIAEEVFVLAQLADHLHASHWALGLRIADNRRRMRGDNP